MELVFIFVGLALGGKFETNLNQILFFFIKIFETYISFAYVLLSSLLPSHGSIYLELLLCFFLKMVNL